MKDQKKKKEDRDQEELSKNESWEMDAEEMEANGCLTNLN